jgi:phage-related minor tail protein
VEGHETDVRVATTQEKIVRKMTILGLKVQEMAKVGDLVAMTLQSHPDRSDLLDRWIRQSPEGKKDFRD